MNWYRNIGNEGDIVLSTRVRLARNIQDFPFPARLGADARNQVCDAVCDALSEDDTLERIVMSELSPSQTVSLAEKHLISPEFASDSTGRSLLLSKEQDVSIMLCEEDHIRIQVIYPGLCLESAFETAEKYDNLLESKFNFAFNERIGYLTQCPTNLGTAMRASVMLHLPALTKKGAMQRLASTVAKLGLTLRGTYGEGSEITGDIYQLSNQVTLGISEESAIKNLSSITTQIISQEKQARAALVKDDDYIDNIYRALGILKSAYKLTSKELIRLISFVRVGASESVIEIPKEKLSALMVELQSATMNVSNGKVLTQNERDVLRAKAVREALS